MQQEAPLTLRGQRGRCRNIKGEPQIYWSFPNPRTLTLFFWVWFMVALGKPKACTTLEVASFSHYVNIEEEPQILGSSSSPRPRPDFLLRVIL